MTITEQMAAHLRDVHFGGNWTSVNLKDVLADVSWQQATAQVYSMNTIATLVFHMNYYISAVSDVLRGGPLNARDDLSFLAPPVLSEQEWQQRIQMSLADATEFAELIAKLPDDILQTDFTDPKYGNYYRNIHGIIEHLHYHLGQIVTLKKVIAETLGDK